jgi:hypothetical protein
MISYATARQSLNYLANPTWFNLMRIRLFRSLLGFVLFSTANQKVTMLDVPHEKPVPVIDAKHVKELYQKLGDDSFEVREKATFALIDMGLGIVPELQALVKSSDNPEVKQRIEAIGKAVENLDQTAIAILRYIENSDATFLRPGKHSKFNGKDFASWLQGKSLLQRVSLTSSAQDFLDKIASESSLHHQPYTVQLPNGTEISLRDWLSKKFKLDERKR